MTKNVTIRCFAPADADEVQNIIHRGLREINCKDYPEKRIEEYCDYFTIEKIKSQAENAHMYVAVSDDGRVVGTGTISPFWGSETESILLTIYVLPDLIGQGIGTAIIRALEKDQYALRAKRIEIPSSVTAVNFYRKMGYGFKDGGEPDEEGLIRMEKRK
jgi:GNAT superfamily N-acetyltransferase